MAGARRRHLVALILVALLAGLGFVVPSIASAGPPDCTLLPLDPSCQTTTTEAPTTTAEPTTTVVDTTTTRAPQQATSTTVQRTTTTERQVVATTTTELEVTTSLNVLIPGDGTEGAESTTTTTVQTETRVSSDGTSDGTLIAVVVGGLIALAVFVSVLTWRYWAATRPAEVSTVGSDHG